MNDFLKELEEYFKNTPREKVLEDWEKVSEYDESGVLVKNFVSKLKPINRGYFVTALVILLLHVFTYLSAYLTGSFANSSLDITKWEPSGRGFIAGTLTICNIFLTFIYVHEKHFEK